MRGARWLAGGVAWAAFSAAVWLAGDALLVAGWRPLDAPLARLAAIAAAAALWLGWELWRTRRARRENERLLASLSASGGDDAAARADHEVALLRARFETALATLRKARFRDAHGERRTVSELPWYMFIGAPGSGKTTALLNAGLRFPLGDPRAERTLQGVGGTRHCDWWFTDQAVLLDTAGRYTTQESDREADSAAWLGFLDLLKRFRPRQPLNGVLVTLSVYDLVHWNDEEIVQYAAHVRERVSELYARLGVRLPVYVLVTKADLLAGFNEFFGEFDAEQRAQVWGMTFEPSEVAAAARGMAARFDREFGLLEKRLYGLLPGRLQEERDLQRRAAIYRFPQQFRSSGPLISSFIDAAFGSGWSGETPLLRGVYFASGTQEGSPIDRVLGTLARSFNLERKVQPPNVGSGKSFFLRRLLHEVIFGESGLAGVDARLERNRQARRVTAFAAIAGAALALALAWTISFSGNGRLIERAAAATADARRELDALPAVRPGDEPRLLAALSRLRDLRQPAADWTLRFGLYQGDKLSAQAERAYRAALRDTLLPHLAASFEHSLRTAPSREVLEGYLALHDPARDAAAVEKGALLAWRLPEASRKDLGGYLRAALAERPAPLVGKRDDALVEQARRRLGAKA